MEVFAKSADEPHGEQKIQKAVSEAESILLRAYFKSDIEKNGIREGF